ncbi:RNA binding protein [[Candida] boidinii]|nr:RNA binding protein [[Candida] boidinii]
MPPKKGVKMDLGSFLADDSYGDSWADDDFDVSSLSVPTKSTGPSARGGAPGFGAPSAPGFGASSEPAFERKEYPIPDAPPYTARFSNLPWDTNEEEIHDFIAEQLSIADPLQDILRFKAPTDRATGRLRGFAFVTFSTRELLEEALKLNGSHFHERSYYVSVAAPEKDDDRNSGRGSRFGGPSDSDWGSVRGEHAQGGYRGDDRPPRRERREEPDLDWGSARENVDQPSNPRPIEDRQHSFRRGDRHGEEQGDRPPRRERREEPELDWGSARETADQPSNPRPIENRQHSFRRGDRHGEEQGDRPPRRERREEPELDWGSARETADQPSNPRPTENRQHSFRRGDRHGEETTERPPRRERRQEPELDWGSARENVDEAERPKSNRSYQRNNSNNNQKTNKPKQEDSFDWDNARSSAPAPTKNHSKRNVKQSEEHKEKENVITDAPKKSTFHVLGVEGDEEDEEPVKKTQSEDKKVKELTTATANVTLESNEDGWEVVKQKK